MFVLILHSVFYTVTYFVSLVMIGMGITANNFMLVSHISLYHALFPHCCTMYMSER